MAIERLISHGLLGLLEVVAGVRWLQVPRERL